ncbi:MAG: hypothetical protein KDD84_23290, partial [Caldilineaceae bacterium]|nr:hypothetical protein [Caldilineaceae bacterium]
MPFAFTMISTFRTFQNLALSPDPRVRRAVIGLLLAAGATAIALLIGVAGPVLGLALAIAIVGGTMILLDTHWGFVALLAVVFGLPFATLPIDIGFKPSLLDVGLGALFFVWVLKLVTGRERRFISSPMGGWIGLFVLMA